MAKTKPQSGAKKSKKHNKNGASNGASKKPKETSELLLAQATALLQESQPADAQKKARRALARLQPTPQQTVASLPALNLLGEISVELGDADAAREYFMQAASLDPEGSLPEASGGGAEKFFWLAQLCEEGGAESVAWFKKGADVLRRDIAELDGKARGAEAQATLDEKRKKLANALCGIAEVYMTDLSWEEDAESRCEIHVAEAVLVAPDSPETLQTLASVRISQQKHDEARRFLAHSIGLWKELPPEDPNVPDFPTRISLARLLMEVGMEEEAIEVLERLVTEDDSSVEAWYLGGWCLHLMAEKRKTHLNGSAAQELETEEGKTTKGLLRASRDWLQNSLKLYEALEYEDDRLRDHALELMEELNKILDEPSPDGEANDDEDEWESEEGSRDEEMEGT